MQWTGECDEGNLEEQQELYDINTFIRAKSGRQTQREEVIKSMMRPNQDPRRQFVNQTSVCKVMPFADDRAKVFHPEGQHNAALLRRAGHYQCNSASPSRVIQYENGQYHHDHPQILIQQQPGQILMRQQPGQILMQQQPGVPVAQPTPDDRVDADEALRMRQQGTFQPAQQNTNQFNAPQNGTANYDRRIVAQPTITERVYPYHFPYDYRSYAYNNPPFSPRFAAMNPRMVRQSPSSKLFNPQNFMVVSAMAMLFLCLTVAFSQANN